MVNPMNVATLLLQYFEPKCLETEKSMENYEYFEKFKDLLEQCSTCKVVCSVDDSLVVEDSLNTGREAGDEEDDSEHVYEETEENDSTDDDSGKEDEQDDDYLKEDEEMKQEYGESQHPRTEVSLEQKSIIVGFWMKQDGNSDRVRTRYRSLASVKNRFKSAPISDKRVLFRWRKQVEMNNCHNHQLWKQLRERVVLRFQEARRNGCSVHDADLARWGVEFAKKNGISNFRASNYWLYHVKKDAHIVTRKVTVFRTCISRNDPDEIKANADQFVEDVKLKKAQFGDQIYNSDESGFQLELHSGRTLEEIGMKSVTAQVQSSNATTHSVTIMPVLGINGHFLPKMMLILQEQSGEFGPRVKKEMFNAPNLYVVASKSGKITKEIMQNFVKEVFIPYVEEKALFILDACPTHRSVSLEDKFVNPTGKLLEKMIMPPGTTGIAQPMDVFLFRPLKNFMRIIEDRVIIDQIDYKLSQRNNLIKLHAAVFCQITSPRFWDAWKYGWYKPGYIEDHPPKFENPVSYCFNLSRIGGSECEKARCSEPAFLICAWCQELICMNHFIVHHSPHLCFAYKD